MDNDKTKICKRSGITGLYYFENITHQDCMECCYRKPLSEFNKNAGGKYGRRTMCRECENKYKAQMRGKYYKDHFYLQKRRVKRYMKKYNITSKEAWDIVFAWDNRKKERDKTKIKRVIDELRKLDPEYFNRTPAERAERLRRKGQELLSELRGETI